MGESSGEPSERSVDKRFEDVGELSEQEQVALATVALSSLSGGARKDVISQEVNKLSPRDQQDLSPLLTPDQPIINYTWRIVVTAFSIILVISAGAVIYAAFTNLEQTQVLLTVFTSTATLLAGLLAGGGLVSSVFPRR
jgi:hypothetical protein